MTRRGFTLVELVFASVIGAMVMVSLGAVLRGVWMAARDTNEELHAMVAASAMRDRLLLGIVSKNESGFHGLLNITNRIEAAPDGSRVLRVDPDGGNEEYESLPLDNKNDRRIVIGRTGVNSLDCVVVTTNAVVSAADSIYNDTESRQRVCVYLWAATESGAVCRMPVYVTTVNYESKETE